jgi:hypothetical protein
MSRRLCAPRERAKTSRTSRTALPVRRKANRRMRAGDPADDRAAIPRAEFPRLVRPHLFGARIRLSPDDRAWTESLLAPAEYALWLRLAANDQVHAVRVVNVTRAKLAASPYEDDGRRLRAALLHDMRKLKANLADAWAGGRNARREGGRLVDRKAMGGQLARFYPPARSVSHPWNGWRRDDSALARPRGTRSRDCGPPGLQSCP